ncbi:MAG: hypothetical protein ABI580_14165 [Burkholderiaceae bacterium]
MRPVIVTITGAILELRAKGLRSREVLDLAYCYETAIKQRIARERAERSNDRRKRSPRPREITRIGRQHRRTVQATSD